MVSFEELPEDCVSNIISYTSPQDACRASLISRRFKFAVNSNVVWEKFLPPDYLEILSEVGSSVVYFTKKELFHRLAQSYLLVDDGKMSFSVEKYSGKKSYMVGARQLTIESADDPHTWKWKSSPHSRFAEVAELYKPIVKILCRFQTRLLSQKITYVAYFVFNSLIVRGGVYRNNTYVNIVYRKADKDRVYPFILFCKLENRNLHMLHQRKRKDGWMEIELGEFFNYRNDDGEVDVHFQSADLDRGLIVEGFEFRPKG